MAKIELKNIVWKEGKNYVAWNLNTNVSSFGETKKEALASLKEALELYFEKQPTCKINKIERLAVAQLALDYA